jgi:hypothetical protein
MTQRHATLIAFSPFSFDDKRRIHAFSTPFCAQRHSQHHFVAPDACGAVHPTCRNCARQCRGPQSEKAMRGEGEGARLQGAEVTGSATKRDAGGCGCRLGGRGAHEEGGRAATRGNASARVVCRHDSRPCHVADDGVTWNWLTGRPIKNGNGHGSHAATHSDTTRLQDERGQGERIRTHCMYATTDLAHA